MKIAVVGAGISGLSTAYLLSQKHDVCVFEANRTVGGHTRTLDVPVNGKTYSIDMGFIVFNERTYPNFMHLLRRLKIPWQRSDMSFGVQCARTGIEFSPTSLDRLFAQRRNLCRPWFYRMALELLVFRRHIRQLRNVKDDQLTLSGFLENKGYSRAFHDYFVIPMGAAIWSSDPLRFKTFPARYFAEFFHNHGFLDARQPQWLAIPGGSSRYIAPLTGPFRPNIRCSHPIDAVRRYDDHIELKSQNEPWQKFDCLVIATHSDQALAMLTDPSQAERDILGAIAYQSNDVVLHTDTTLLPTRHKAWASWNYFIPENPENAVALTYNMNKLQTLDAPVTFCVSLNRTADIEKHKIIRRLVSHHPVYTPRSLAARARRGEINGRRRTYYCGAYWGYGFHEDGVNSALAVASKFEIGWAS